jgi:hypothetical protein
MLQKIQMRECGMWMADGERLDFCDCFGYIVPKEVNMSSQKETKEYKIRIAPLSKEESYLLRVLSLEKRKQVLLDAAREEAQELSRKEKKP